MSTAYLTPLSGDLPALLALDLWLIPCCAPIGNGECTAPWHSHTDKPTDIGKVPLTPHGYFVASNDPDQISAWSDHFPGCNWGVSAPHSNLVILDEDSEGELDRLFDDLGIPMPDTYIVTGYRGRHMYFRPPDGEAIRQGNLRSQSYDIDIRGNSGYVIAAGSLHHSGVLYTVTTDEPIAACPEALADLLRKPRQEVTSTTDMPSVGTYADATALLDLYRVTADSRRSAVRALFDVQMGPDTGRYGVQWRLTTACREFGMPPEDIFTVAVHAGCNKFQKRRQDLWRQVQKAVAHVDAKKEKENAQVNSSTNGVVPQRKLRVQPKERVVEKSLNRPLFSGLLGEAITAMAPETESDPYGLMLTVLAEFGNAIGSKPYFLADGTPHGTRVNVVLGGPTAKGKKGTAQSNVDWLMREADPEWWSEAKASGLSSGEGVITAIESTEQITSNNGSLHVSRPHIKRVMLIEPEFSRVITASKRPDSILPDIIRQAYDGTDLSILTKKPVRGNGHISIIGHITVGELHNKLDLDWVSNGFMNRFLFANVSRSKMLPRGGNTKSIVAEFAPKIGDVLGTVRDIGEMSRSKEAWSIWERVYINDWADLDDMSARAAAHVTRLSMIYALAEGSATIEARHMRAALDMWKYCVESVNFIFKGSLTGNVGKLYDAVKKSGSEGLSPSMQFAVFSKNISGKLLKELRDTLVAMDLVEPFVPTGQKCTSIYLRALP